LGAGRAEGLLNIRKSAAKNLPNWNGTMNQISTAALSADPQKRVGLKLPICNKNVTLQHRKLKKRPELTNLNDKSNLVP